MISRPRSHKALLETLPKDKEEADLLRRYDRLEQLKKKAELIGDNYIVATTSTGDLAIYFPDSQNLKKNNESTTIPDQQPPSNPEPLSIRNYFMTDHREGKEKETKKMTREMHEAQKTAREMEAASKEKARKVEELKKPGELD